MVAIDIAKGIPGIVILFMIPVIPSWLSLKQYSLRDINL